MPFADTNGISLHYDIVGDGPPLCLIGGYRQSSDAWPRPFIEKLSLRCRVITFDNRGTGRSDKPAGGYDFHHQALDVVGLLDAAGVGRTHLLGFSMGGAIAQRVVVGFPERIDRLALFGTFCGGVFAQSAPWSVMQLFFMTEGLTPEEAARRIWPVTYGADYLAANADAVERQMRRELAHPTPGFVARKQMEALRGFDSHADLPHIRAATLVATGGADKLVMPRNSKILASRIPGARLEILQDLGHRAIWESPDEMADLVGDFFAPSQAAKAAPVNREAAA